MKIFFLILLHSSILFSCWKNKEKFRPCPLQNFQKTKQQEQALELYIEDVLYQEKITKQQELINKQHCIVNNEIKTRNQIYSLQAQQFKKLIKEKKQKWFLLQKKINKNFEQAYFIQNDLHAQKRTQKMIDHEITVRRQICESYIRMLNKIKKEFLLKKDLQQSKQNHDYMKTVFEPIKRVSSYMITKSFQSFYAVSLFIKKQLL